MDNGSVSGVLTGTGGFTKTTAGTVTISSTSTYTGVTAIQAGTLATTGANQLAAAGSLNVSSGGTFKMGGDQTLASITGSGAINLGNGSLTTGSTTSTFAGSITGNGGLTKAGPGTLTLCSGFAFLRERLPEPCKIESLFAGSRYAVVCNILWKDQFRISKCTNAPAESASP